MKDLYLNCIAVILCIILFAFVISSCQNKNREGYMQYSEVNPSCQTGSRLCQLSTGKGGLCDNRNGRCVDIHPLDKVPSTLPHHIHLRPHQSLHENCIHGASVCHLKDGSSGSCGISGVCFPATHNVQ